MIRQGLIADRAGRGPPCCAAIA